MSETPSAPQIVEAYKNYAPSFDAPKTIRLLLRHVPEKYLVGLKTIVLTNRESLSHDQRRRRPWSRGRKYSMNRVLGDYHQAWKGESAWIRIFVDQTVAGNPLEIRWLPFLRTHAIAKVLYHEIGHHIHKTSRPEHREREDVADEWQKRLMRIFSRRRYWYLIPIAFVYRLARKRKKAPMPGKT